MHPLFILASNSPRRRALLTRVIPGHLFTSVASRVRERIFPGEIPEKFVLRMAEKKARTVLKKCRAEAKNCKAVIGADTVVVLGKKILQQPKGRADARKMLWLLSGKEHKVMTAVCFLSSAGEKTGSILVKSKVWFKKLSKRMINDYIETGEAVDKAGAYAIQGRGRSMVRKYRGSYTNIVGLPVKEIRDFIKSRFRFIPLEKTTVEHPR